MTKRKAPILSQTNIAESLKQGKKDKKNKKQKFRKHKRDHIEEQKEQILAISVNTIEADLKKKYPNIMCYNYDKKNHYSKSYLKSLKN